MKKLGIRFYLIVTILSLLCSCAMSPDPAELTKNHKNTEYVAMLTDPVVRKNFRALKAAARNVHIYQQNGQPYIAEQDVRKLNALSLPLINYLHYQYHIDPVKHKVHTYIGRNQYNSCYQYYNSLETSSMGKDCHAFSTSFASCGLCNQYINDLRSRPGINVIHSQWWDGENITALVETLHLRNGDSVYLGFELSSK